VLSSVAVRVWLPAVLKVRLNAADPDANVALRGKAAARSVLAKCTVPL